MDKFDASVFLSLQGEGTRILVLGGGDSAFIKIKTLINHNFTVDCMSQEFSSKLIDLSKVSKKLALKSFDFKEELIENYHLVVLCTNDEGFNTYVRSLCRDKMKLYVDTTRPEESQGILCATRSSKNVALGVRIRDKNPTAAVYLCSKGVKLYEELDDYVEYITTIRNKIQDRVLRKKVGSYLCSDEFLKIYKSGAYKEILLKAYPELMDLLEEGV